MIHQTIATKITQLAGVFPRNKTVLFDKPQAKRQTLFGEIAAILDEFGLEPCDLAAFMPLSDKWFHSAKNAAASGVGFIAAGYGVLLWDGLDDNCYIAGFSYVIPYDGVLGDLSPNVDNVFTKNVEIIIYVDICI